MSDKPELLRYNGDDIEIARQETVYKGHFELQKLFFRHKLYNGEMSDEICRELLIKGEASVLIAYDPAKDNVVLVEQIRIGANTNTLDENPNNTPWLLELVAGMVDKQESPAVVAMREAEEEAGLKVEEVKHVMSMWDSPGGVRERLHFFVGLVDTTGVGGVYGLDEEGEDILVHVVPREQAYQWVEDGTIDNALAVIGLQWLQLNYKKYQK